MVERSDRMWSTGEGNGKVDVEALQAITFDPYTHGYYQVSKRVGEAFKDGLKLK